MDSSILPAIVLIVAGVGLVVMLVLQAIQINQLRQRLEMLTRGADGRSLEGVLDANLELVHQVSEDLDDLTARTARLEVQSASYVAHVGLVRFNPFPDTGGNQSFALAMLDGTGDGFIVSSLHSRTGTRIYAKAVAAGKAESSLSAEESQAMDLAGASRTARPVHTEQRLPAPRARDVPAAPAIVVAEDADEAATGGAVATSLEDDMPGSAASLGSAEEVTIAPPAVVPAASATAGDGDVSVAPSGAAATGATPADERGAAAGSNASGFPGAVARSRQTAAAAPLPEASPAEFKEPIAVVKGQAKGEVSPAGEGAGESERTGRRPVEPR